MLIAATLVTPGAACRRSSTVGDELAAPREIGIRPFGQRQLGRDQLALVEPDQAVDRAVHGADDEHRRRRRSVSVSATCAPASSDRIHCRPADAVADRVPWSTPAVPADREACSAGTSENTTVATAPSAGHGRE